MSDKETLEMASEHICRALKEVAFYKDSVFDDEQLVAELMSALNCIEAVVRARKEASGS